MTGGHDPILDVEGLKTCFFTERGVVRAVDGVDLCIEAGRTVALVGESGCGKTAAALSILNLVPRPPGKAVGGRVRFKGEDLLQMPPKALRRIRGNRISMVFQEPMTSLNPVMKIGKQVREVLCLHRNMSRPEADREAIRMLHEVGIPAAEKRFHSYPYQLSGGMNQRVMMAMALLCNPDLLIADEPTTALDVTVQAQILALLKSKQEETGMAILLITHDLSIVAEMADHIRIMYASKIVEHGARAGLFEKPFHPYTRGLFDSLPQLDKKTKRLDEIPGNVPDPADFPPGCRFHPRCPRATAVCAGEEPRLEEIFPGRWVACHHPMEYKGSS